MIEKRAFVREQFIVALVKMILLREPKIAAEQIRNRRVI